MKDISHYINGLTIRAAGGRNAPVFNPATGEQTAVVHLASNTEVGQAVFAARSAFDAWAKTTPLRRGRILNRFLGILQERTGELASVITAEHGKVLSDAKGEIQRGMEVVEFATSIPQLLKGEITEDVGPGIDSHSLRQPLGVVAGITPFNFPVMVPTWMFPVAIACGNCFILKPACRTACSTSSTVTRKLSTPSSSIRISRPSVLSDRRRSRDTSMRPRHATASDARHWAVPRTT